MPVALSVFHCMPVRSTKRMASKVFLSSTLGLWQPRGWVDRTGKKGFRLFPQPIGDTSAIVAIDESDHSVLWWKT